MRSCGGAGTVLVSVRSAGIYAEGWHILICVPESHSTVNMGDVVALVLVLSNPLPSGVDKL